LFVPQNTPYTDICNISYPKPIENFKALNIAVALSLPNVKETIWLVPERKGYEGMELTLEDVQVMDMAIKTFGGELIEATRINGNSPETRGKQKEADSDNL
jgi:hypothetical protein